MLLTGGSLADAPRWRTSGGVATIHYRINPLGAVTGLDRAQIVTAIRAGFATWQSAVPSLRFVYDGTTNALAVSGDGQNVVGFGDVTSSHLGQVTTQPGPNRTIAEADLLLATGRVSVGTDGFGATGWTWLPCGTSGKPCTDVQTCRELLIVERCDHDLQNAVTHEAGHWLWLGDLTDPQDEQLTMYGVIGAKVGGLFLTERHKVTLGLGDVIGARALYPCQCAMPKIVQP